MTNDNDPYLMIAADSHAGLPTEQYRTYLESRFHDAFDGPVRFSKVPPIAELASEDRGDVGPCGPGYDHPHAAMTAWVHGPARGFIGLG